MGALKAESLGDMEGLKANARTLGGFKFCDIGEGFD